MTKESASVEIEVKRTRKRVLLLAYFCSPYRGSEWGGGWHRAVQTAGYFDTWVISGKNSEKDIRRYFAENGEIPGLHFCFVPETRFLDRIPVIFYVALNLWHRRVYQLAVKLNKELCFDLIHQVNMCSFREPGYLWKIDAPFIWGPLGGTQNYPFRFLGQAGIVGAISEATRSVVNVLQLRFSRRVRKAARKAAVVLTANSNGQRSIRRAHKVNPVLFSDVGLTTIKKKVFADDDLKRPLRILWLGLFQHRKALQLLLYALAKMPPGYKYELRIHGHGPLEKKWRRLSQRLGIESFCTWIGWVPKYEDVLREYEWADIFAFTSLRDTTAAVVVEAISHGAPIICFDHQGVGDIVTHRCGVKLPVTTPKRAILELRDAIVSFAQNRGKVKSLSEGAIERAAEYLWTRSGDRTAELYQKAMIDHYQKPKSKRNDS